MKNIKNTKNHFAKYKKNLDGTCFGKDKSKFYLFNYFKGAAMEIIIAILWYLNLLIPGTTYTEVDFNALVEDNQAAIQTVQNDAVQTQNALDYYDESFETSVIEFWEPNPFNPTKR